MLNSGDLDFSFSGLKTAVMVLVRDRLLTDTSKADLAAEFQEAVTEVLAEKAVAACRQRRLSRLVVAGGVGANLRLRQRLNAALATFGGQVFYPAVVVHRQWGNDCPLRRAAIVARADAGIAIAIANPESRAGRFCHSARWPLDALSAPQESFAS